MVFKAPSYYEQRLWCYTDKLSYTPGETIGFKVHSPLDECDLRISRVGASEELVWEQVGLPSPTQEIPPDAYVNGCNWPTAFTVEVPADWRSGYYRIRLSSDKLDCEHFVVIKPGKDKPRSPYALVLATNTYQAYNSWGGKSLYGADSYLPDPEALDEEGNAGVPVVSLDRPFSKHLIAQDREKRVTSMTRRAYGDGWSFPAFIHDLQEADLEDFTAWNVFAGFLNKWEHAFLAWAESQGYSVDCYAQADLDEDPRCLDGHQCYISVGHDEYWSASERDVVESFVENGGNAFFMSGNACYWQVRFDWKKQQMICHKYNAHITDPVMGTEDESTLSGMWSDPVVGRPENLMMGTSFTRGGYSNWGLHASMAPGGLTVYRPEHWALKDTELFYGDMFGDAVQIAGFEVDGCALQIVDGLPHPTGEDGTDKAFEIVAMAPASLGAPERTSLNNNAPIGFRDAAVVAERVFGDASEEGRDRARRGNAVMGTFQKGKGAVFTTGTCEWAYGLSHDDPAVAQITKNVLERFARN